MKYLVYESDREGKRCLEWTDGKIGKFIFLLLWVNNSGNNDTIVPETHVEIKTGELWTYFVFGVLYSFESESLLFIERFQGFCESKIRSWKRHLIVTGYLYTMFGIYIKFYKTISLFFTFLFINFDWKIDI